jgi:hypothetical protein
MKPQYIAHSEFLNKHSVLYTHPANCSVIVCKCSYFTVLCTLLYRHLPWFDILWISGSYFSVLWCKKSHYNLMRSVYFLKSSLFPLRIRSRSCFLRLVMTFLYTSLYTSLAHKKSMWLNFGNGTLISCTLPFSLLDSSITSCKQKKESIYIYVCISFICDKSVTTQNLALLSYWYRKKRLQLHV